MGLTKATNRMTSGAPANLMDFGAVGDGVTDDTAAIQAALDYCNTNRKKLIVPVGTFIVLGELTFVDPATSGVDNYLNIEGEGSTTKNLPGQSEFKLTNPTIGSTLFKANEVMYQIKNMRFTTDDETNQRNLIAIGELGTVSTQNSAQGLGTIEGCVFKYCGGTALALGGEHYGSITNCVFMKLAQAIVISKNGETNIDKCNFSTQVNSSFTAGAGNYDAYIYIKDTVTKFSNCVAAMSEDYRVILEVENPGHLVISDMKLETPGRTTLTYPIFEFNTLASCAMVTLDNLYITCSSMLAGATQSMIKTTGTAILRNLAVRNCVFTYSPATDIGVSAIDCTVNKPKNIEINSNYKEAADNALIKFTTTEPDVNGTFCGIRGTNIDLVTVRSQPFTVLASQTDTIVPWGGRNFITYLANTQTQIYPVSMSVQASATIGGSISFKHQRDASNSDLCELPSTNSNTMAQHTKFGLRAQYIYVPESAPTADRGERMYYTSDAAVSTSVEYIVEYTYAIIRSEAALRKRFEIDIV
jgi:hypothetical protein